VLGAWKIAGGRILVGFWFRATGAAASFCRAVGGDMDYPFDKRSSRGVGKIRFMVGSFLCGGRVSHTKMTAGGGCPPQFFPAAAAASGFGAIAGMTRTRRTPHSRAVLVRRGWRLRRAIPTYKDATPKKLSAYSYQPDMAASIFKDDTKIEKVKFGSRVFWGEWMVRCGRSRGWGFESFFIFLFWDGLGLVTDR